VNEAGNEANNESSPREGDRAIGLWPGMNAEAFRLEANRLLEATAGRWMVPEEERRLLRAIAAYVRSATPEQVQQLAALVQ